MNCMCLAVLTRSWMRKTTKLAGMKDMAKITQMDTSTSTEVVTLETDQQEGDTVDHQCESSDDSPFIIKEV